MIVTARFRGNARGNGTIFECSSSARARGVGPESHQDPECGAHSAGIVYGWQSALFYGLRA
jgi:hypothetical protein